mgnify:FL=1
MKKRILSVFMALALCLTLLPAPAWAAEDTLEGGTIVQEEQEEATPATSEQAVEDASEGGTIVQEEQEEATTAISEQETEDATEGGTIVQEEQEEATPALPKLAAKNGITVQNGEDSTVENAVAEVTIDGTTTQYPTLTEAITAAQNSEGSTVKLLTDVTTTSEIEVDSGTFTIDLNGKKLDRTSPFTLSVKENGNVTVTSTQGTGTISNAQNTAIFVNNGATVHVTKGVRLNKLYAMKNAKLTLDVGVIITGKFFTQADNIAPFLAGKALQSCDENGTLIEGQYKSIYDSYRMDDTGCVIVIEHKSCTGTPSTETPCPICGYDGTQTKPTEPENPNPDVAEVNGTKYKTLAEAIKAANGADITLLTIVTENVVVDGASIKASIILGNGKTIDDIPYPSNWVADRYGIPLTMEAGEITLKDGALAQFNASSSADVAIALKGGTLIVETTVTKIIGSNRSDSVQHAAIEATGGVLDLQGNTLLDGGLTMSGDAQLKNKLTAGTFTNSGSEAYSVSVEGSSQYTTVFDLLETGYAFAVYNEDAPTGDVIAKDTTTRELTEDVAVIKCTHKGANNKSLFKDNTCTGCGFTCAHETIKNGVCTVCNTAMGAQDNTGKYYLNLAEAFEGVADGGTVTMLTTLKDDDTISFCRDADGKPVEKTVTFMMNGHSLSYEGTPSLNIESGKLIIGDEATISQPAQTAQPAVFVDNDEQSKGRGTLEFKGKANLTGGLLIQNYGKLVGGLKKGTIITSNGTYSVSVERSIDTYGNVLGLLGDGLAFAKYDENAENKAGALVDGSVKQLTEDVIVVAHTTHTMGKDNKCACGFSCTHTNTKGVSTIGKDGKCTVCGTQVAAGIGETYYTDVKSALDAAADGQTVRLLANGMLPRDIYASKTLTLDLNGHSLSGYSLNVGGLTATSQIRTGNLTVIDSSGGNGAVGVTVRDGGTLVFDPENDSTTLLQLEVWGGTVELYGGRILRKGLQLNNSIVLGDLLPRKAGLAYYREGSDTQLTLKEAASKTCDLVVKSCAHGGKNGFDENATACPYCNAPAVAEAALNDGEGGRLRRRFTNLQTAIDADRDGGATLQLLADVTGDYTIDGTQDTGLNLNGHCIKGTVTVKAAAGNNTTTFSNTQNNTTASIDAVVAHRGAKLAGTRYPAVIGKLTLADTTKWKDILQQPTRLGFRVTNTDGTHKWYAPDDVNGSQLNNVIINSLPITTKTLNLKVDGKNLTGNSPKVERGTTVQLCAGCNGKGADVYIYIGESVGNNNPTYSQKKAEYKKIGSWYYVVDLDANTIGTYDIYFTASKDGYSVTSSHKKLTVIKAATPASAITAPAANALTYNGNEQLLVTAGSVEAKYGEMQYRLGTSGGFSTDIPTATDAGTYTVYYKVAGAEGYDDTIAKSIKVTISPVKIKGIGNVASVSKTYDGSASVTLPKTNLAFLGAAGSMTPIPGSVYRITDARFTTRQDDFIYENSPDAGTKEAISFTLTLTDSNYAFEGKAASVRSANFNFTSKDDRFKINQATVTPAEITLYVYNDVAKTYTLNLATLLPKLTPGCEYGKIKYQGCDYHFTDSTYLDSNNGMFVSNDGILTLPIVAAHSTDVNKQIGKITAPVVAANYQQFELTIKVVIGEKITPVKSDDFKISATGIIYRQTLENSRLTVEGTMKDPTTGEEVKGTFAWPNKYDIPSRTGDCYVDWIFTPAEGYEKYAAVTDIVKVHVAPKSIEGATITLEKYEFAYNAAEQSPKITGVTLENWYETRITYVIKSGDKATDANDSIPLTIEGTGNYTGKATVKWKITPKEVTPTIEVAPCTYTGDALEPTVTVKDDTGNIIDPKEYEIFYSNNTNAGTATVTVKDVEGGNYVLSEAVKTFEITKAAAPAAEAGSLTITNGLHKTYSLGLSTLLPKLTAPCDYGEIIYDKKVDTALGKGTYVTLVNGKTGELTLEANRSGTDEGQFGTITVTISTSNYQDITLTINVSAKNRLTPVLTGTPTLTPTELTYGESLSKIKITSTMKVGDTVVKGTFSWQQPGDTILDASTLGHDVGWKFTPEDGNTYTEATGTATVRVNKAQQYGKVSMAGYTYGQTPGTPTLTDRTGDLNAQVTYGYAVVDSGSVQTWDISNPPALNAGTYRMFARIGETGNYNEHNTRYCEFVVEKATPDYTVPTGLTAKSGQRLADIKLPDGWSWMDSSKSVGDASTVTKTFQAKFTPTDTDNYNMVENIELEVMVNKADSGSLKTEFTPTDTDNYNTVENMELKGMVKKADGGSLKTVELTQKYTDASVHTYTPDWSGLPGGQVWSYNSEYSVSTGSNITLTKHDFAADGSLLTYAISGGKAGDTVTITLKASCNNYKDFTIILNITLTEKDSQEALVIIGADSVFYGQTLTLTTRGGSGTGAVTYRIDTAHSTGEATIDPNTGVLTPVKVGSVSVIATKAGDKDYNDVTSAPFVLMIKPATPAGEPPKDTKITTDSVGDDWDYSNYTIKATAGAGGSISPSGDVSVREGEDQTFTITTDEGYAVADVKIDGKSIGAVNSYAFENVRRTHTIEVIFVKDTASASTGDSSNLPLWSVLLLASTLTLAGAVHYKRKRAR